MKEKKNFLTSIGLLAFSAVLFEMTGCLSIHVGGDKPKSSSDATYHAPLGYQIIRTDKADAAFRNPKTSSTIGFHSLCGEKSEPALETVAQELYGDVEDFKMSGNRKYFFNEREALEVDVEGKIEGLSTQARSVIFRKNGCTYTLSLVAKPGTFTNDLPTFQKFTESFRVP